MGTRNLTIVIHKGQIKMAQYGQWDGYPGGVGRDIAAVLEKTPLPNLKRAMDGCRFLSKEELGALGKNECPPLLNRDNSGGHALKIILDNGGGELYDSSAFAGDSLFCEWAYVIDLDEGMVEVYKGFNKLPLAESDRFYHLTGVEKGEYYPVRLLKSFKIKDFTAEAISSLRA